MANLFLYAGTVFLRESGIDPAQPARSEVKFALDHLLPQEMDWDIVRNVSMATVGQPQAAGRRSFEFAPSAKSGSSPIEASLGDLTNSLFEQPSAKPISNPVVSAITKAVASPARVKLEAGPTLVGNSSGRVTKTEIDALVQAIIRSLGADRLRKEGLFSIGDCNSFHNAAYIFGSVALHGRRSPVLVLNMDQHKDMGKATQTVVSSDTWATSVLTQAQRPAAYLALGSGGRAGGNQLAWQFTPDGTTVQSSANNRGLIPAVSAAQLTGAGAGPALAAAINAMLGQAAFQAGFGSVYITVDRDCMMRNWTQWGEIGAVFDNYQQVVDALEAFMLELTTASPGVELVGMDVTGLPEAGFGPLVDGTNDPDTVSARRFQYTVLQRELSAYHAFYAKWANLTARGRPGKLSSANTGMRCSACGKVHGWVPSSVFGRWHSCPTCARTYCSSCGYSMAAAPTNRRKLCQGVDFNGAVCGGAMDLIA